jgi:hypothetical protein
MARRRGTAARSALGLHPLHAHERGIGGVLRFRGRPASNAKWIGLDFSPAARALPGSLLSVHHVVVEVGGQ